MNATLFVTQTQFDAITLAWQEEERMLATKRRESTMRETNEVIWRLFESYAGVLGDASVLDLIANYPDLKLVVDAAEGAAARLVTGRGEQVWPTN